MVALVHDCILRSLGPVIYLLDGCRLWAPGLLCGHNHTEILHRPLLRFAIWQRFDRSTMVWRSFGVRCSVYGYAVRQEAEYGNKQETTAQRWQA